MNAEGTPKEHRNEARKKQETGTEGTELESPHFPASTERHHKSIIFMGFIASDLQQTVYTLREEKKQIVYTHYTL